MTSSNKCVAVLYLIALCRKMLSLVHKAMAEILRCNTVQYSNITVYILGMTPLAPLGLNKYQITTSFTIEFSVSDI